MKASKKKEQFAEIVQIINNAQENVIKSINVELINSYWNIGAYISQEITSSNWGDKTIEELVAFIKKHNPTIKSYDRRALYRMKQRYETYSFISYNIFITK